MVTVYPSQIDSPATLTTAVDNSTPVDAVSVNQLRDAIVAIETELGVDPGTNFTTVRNRLDVYEMLINQILQGGGGGGSVNFGGDLSGTNVSQTVVGIQKRPVSSTAPTSGQALVWNGTIWTPQNVSGFSAGGDLSGSSTSQTVIGIQNIPVPAPSGSSTVLSWNGSVLTWNVVSSGYSTPPNVGLIGAGYHIGLNYLLDPVYNSTMNSTPGMIPVLNPPNLSNGYGLGFVIVDTNVSTINGQPYGPAAYIANYGSLARYDEVSSSLVQIPIDDVPNSSTFLIDAVTNGTNIYTLSYNEVVKINTVPFEYGVEESLSRNSLGGFNFNSSTSFIDYDTTNNKVLVFQSSSSGTTANIYAIDNNLTTVSSHTINTSTVTNFSSFFTPSGFSSFMKGKFVNGFLYVPAIDNSGTPNLIILKINTTTFATTAFLNTGHPAQNGGISSAGAASYMNIAYSPAANALFVSVNGAVLKINLTTFTVAQALTSVTDGGCIAVADTYSQLAVTTITGGTGLIYQIKNTTSTMTLGTTVSYNQPPGYFGGPGVGSLAFYSAGNGGLGSILAADTDNDVVYEFNYDSLDNISFSRNIGVGTGVSWTPGNLLNARYAFQLPITSNYTVSYSESYIPCNTSGASFTITLPSSQIGASTLYPIVGEYHVIADGNPLGSFSINSLTVSGGGSAKIWFNGTLSTSITLNTSGQVARFVYDGTNWTAHVSLGSYGDIAPITGLPEVVKLRGNALSATSPSTGNTLGWSGSAWTPSAVNLAGGSNYVTGTLPGSNVSSATTSTLGVVELAGDLGGTATSVSVLNIHGASVPAAGSLTTGNVLQVSGTSSLTYGAVNLGGGSNYVTGTLPAGNQASQTMGGDVSGTTASSTVVKIQGNSVTSGGVTKGQFLVGSATNTWAPTTLSTDISSSATTAGSLSVVHITGSGLLIPFAATIEGDSTYNSNAGYPVSYSVANISMSSDANLTLSNTQLISPILRITSSVSLTATRNIILPTTTGASYTVYNGTTGGQSLQFIGSSGTGVTVPNGLKTTVYFDGTNYVTAGIVVGGDLTATTNISQTVAKIQGNPVSSTSPTAGQFLIENSGASGSAWTSISGDTTASTSTPGALTVTGIRGNSVPSPSGTNTVLEWTGSAFTWGSVSGSVTWANDLVNSSGTAQYVSSLSYSSSSAGGTITINGTGTVLQWASNTTPTFNQATVAGTGTNNGVTFTVKAQAGQNQTGATANNNGGNLVLSSGAAGTGGSGAAGVAGNVLISTGGTTQLTISPSAITHGIPINWSSGSVPNYGYSAFSLSSDANFTPSGSQYNAGELAITSSVSLTATRNIVLPLTAGAEWIVYNHTTGGQSLQIIGSSGTGYTVANGSSAVVWTDGTNFYGVSGGGSSVTWANDLVNSTNTAQYVSSLSYSSSSAGGTITINGTGTVLQWASNTTPTLNQAVVAGTGTNNGVTSTIQAQAGQAQSGANNNNNGGNLVLAGGVAGTGGSGTTGTAGSVIINTGSTTQITVSPSAVTLTPAIHWATSSSPILGAYLGVSMTSDANITLSSSQYNAYELAFTSTVSLTATRNVVFPLSAGASWIVYNNTTGSQSLQFIGSSGSGFTLGDGYTALIWTDGTNFYGITTGSSGGGGSFTAAGDLSGSSSSQTVIGIRSNSVPSLPSSGSGTSALTWNGSTFSWSSIGTTSVRLTAPDTNTLIYWKLDETAAPFANSGTYGALNLRVSYGSPQIGVNGIFGNAVAFKGSSGLNTATVATNPNTTNITVSVWVYPFTFAANDNVVNKEYRADGTHSSPYSAFGIGQLGSGQWQTGIAVSGTAYSAQVTADPFLLVANEWQLLSFTYDGTTLKSYYNGILAASTSISGVIDYGPTTSSKYGPFGVGANGNGSSQSSDFIIDDVRIENTLRSQSYLQAMYKQGIGWPDVVLISDAQVSPTAAIQGTKISPNFGTQAINTTGSATLGATSVTSLSTSLITNSGKEVYTGISSPTVSGSGQGSIYFDSTSNEFLISQNANGYLPLTQRTVHSTITASSYSVVSTDDAIPVNTTSNVITITLPSSPTTGEVHTIFDVGLALSTHALTISGNGKNILTDSGALSSVVFTVNATSVTLLYNGSSWSII